MDEWSQIDRWMDVIQRMDDSNYIYYKDILIISEIVAMDFHERANRLKLYTELKSFGSADHVHSCRF